MPPSRLYRRCGARGFGAEEQAGEFDVLVDLRPMNAEAADLEMVALGWRGAQQARIPLARKIHEVLAGADQAVGIV